MFGGKLKRFDSAKAERMRGVKKIVPVGEDAVAVVADTWWHAKTALDAVAIEWDAGDNAKVSSASIDAMLTEGISADKTFVDTSSGDSKAAIAGAATIVEAVYSYPFQTHACMEPMNATALYTHERCEVWCPTQDPHKALAAVADAAGLPSSKCEVNRVPLGGGFGRRLFMDYVTQAVLIAKEIPGTPVKLLWSREEDMAHGKYHPVMQAKLIGGLDAGGNLAGLEIRLSGQSITAAVEPKELKDGKDREVFRGLYPERRRLARVPYRESHDRPRDAQHARAAGLVARRERQPQCDLPRVLHGRTRPCDRTGCARIPPQADDGPSEGARGARRGRKKRRLGREDT